MTGEQRNIGPWGAFSVVAGSMLGVGIFLSPPEMARAVPSMPIFLAVWVVAGVIVLGGAVAYAELGVRLPRAGGDYVFHREAFGRSVAFATGWALFGAIFSGSIAAVALALCQYQIPALTGVDLSGAAFHLPLIGAVSYAQLVASAIVLVVTSLNVAGVRPAAYAQEATTFVPLVVLAVLGVAALGIWAVDAVPPRPASVLMPPELTTGGLVTAYLAAYFAYSGWNQVAYVAGEVAEPERNIPRALVGGSLAVTALYLVLCLAFVLVLGMSGLANAIEAGSEVAGLLAGERARWAMNLLVLLCLLASLNGTILGAGRVGFAMGRDGVLWRRAGQLDAAHGTPRVALWLQAAWSVALVISNRFEGLLLAVSLTMVVTGSLTVVALFVLRRREGPPAGWRAWGYPWLPAIYLGSSAFVLVVQLHGVLAEAASPAPLLGLGVVVLAYVGHRLVSAGRRAADAG